MADKPKTRKIIAKNRKAGFNYHISDTYEAGLVLHGDEVKSLRMGKCSISEAFARIENGEAKLYNMNIPEFKQSSHFSSDPLRTKKLLLKKKEISRLWGLTSRKGYTLVPLQVYFSPRGLAKVEIALAQGKHTYDKRKKLKEEFQKREAQRQTKPYR
jgi:SsrA-binding protein